MNFAESKHPCFNGSCGSAFARIHLPVAPACNIQCNYCRRDFDCPNESRPGVTTKVLTPAEALERYRVSKKLLPNLTVAGIAGPGDALANAEATLDTLRRIRAEDASVLFCLSTNGLLLPRYVDALYAAGVSHITVTVNAVDPAIGAKIYHHIDYDGARYTGEDAARILLENQLAGISAVSALGLVCKVNIVMLKGVNDTHIPSVVVKVKECGAAITNIMQHIPVAGSAFEAMPLVRFDEVTIMRRRCGVFLPQMYHCRQCRADAVGTLDKDQSYLFSCKENALPAEGDSRSVAPPPPAAGAPVNRAPRYAVCSKSGRLVDQHFGHATDFLIFEWRNGRACFAERREVSRYCEGPEGCSAHEEKLAAIIRTVEDCAAVLTMRIGEAPRMLLAEKGVTVHVTYNLIEDAVRDAQRVLFPAGI